MKKEHLACMLVKQLRSSRSNYQMDTILRKENKLDEILMNDSEFRQDIEKLPDEFVIQDAIYDFNSPEAKLLNKYCKLK